MNSEFRTRLEGRFFGVLSWPQLDELWTVLRAAPTGWYATMSGMDAKPSTLRPEEFDRLLAEVDALLRREHREDYCGIVYVDDLTQPAFVKIYDPNNLGSSCGTEPGRVPPRWVLSRIPPDVLDDAAPLPGNRRRWWQNLLGA